VTMAKVSPLLYLVQAFHCEASVLQ
jgi:hypothetical protein